MKNYIDKLTIIITTLFGLGYAPLLSGTLASIAAVVIFWAIKTRVYFVILAIISIIVSFLLASRAEKIFQEKDCKKIIIDDFSGMLLPLMFIPRDIRYVTCAYFDI